MALAAHGFGGPNNRQPALADCFHDCHPFLENVLEKQKKRAVEKALKTEMAAKTAETNANKSRKLMSSSHFSPNPRSRQFFCLFWPTHAFGLKHVTEPHEYWLPFIMAWGETMPLVPHIWFYLPATPPVLALGLANVRKRAVNPQPDKGPNHRTANANANAPSRRQQSLA